MNDYKTTANQNGLEFKAVTDNYKLVELEDE